MATAKRAVLKSRKSGAASGVKRAASKESTPGVTRTGTSGDAPASRQESSSAPSSTSSSAATASASKVASGTRKKVKVERRKDKDQDSVRKKLVRDSFTMPEADYRLIASLKAQALAIGVPVKKSELLRTGLVVLSRLPTPQLAELIAAMPKIKTGRPGKKKK